MITEDEYDEELMLLNKHERKVKILKEEYEMDDYLNNEETMSIMTFEHYNKYVDNVGMLIEKYVKDYVKDNMIMGYLDNGGEKLVGEIMEMVYRYINKEYDLWIFYECPELATSLILKGDK